VRSNQLRASLVLHTYDKIMTKRKKPMPTLLYQIKDNAS